MLDIADSRFQQALLAEAQRAGKLPANHRIPDRHRRNLPEALEQAFAPHRAAGRFGALPYGTDLTTEEIALARSLRRLKTRAETPGGKLGIAASIALARPRDPAIAPLLERMNLARPRGLRERFLRRLVTAALSS